MNAVRFKLYAHVLIVFTGVLVSSVALAAGANWISSSNREKPAYVILAQQDIQNTKTKQEDLDRVANIARIVD